MLLVLLPQQTLVQVHAEEAEPRIETGIYIGDVDVSGLTEDEAVQKVQDYIDEISQAEITLNAMNDNSHTVPAEEIGLTWTNADVVAQAVKVGKSGNIVERYKTLKDLEHERTVNSLLSRVRQVS